MYPYPGCGICGREFNSYSACRQHMNATGYIYECDTCEEDFYTHDDPCNKGFENENNLRQHLNSGIRRGTDIPCPFCKRRFATATGVTHHVETGSCPKARSMNRDTILAKIRRCDPNHIITKNLIRYDVESSITVTPASWNDRIGMYVCYLCHKGFRNPRSLDNHVNSLAHKEKVYQCPG
ncbi:uncharacterized protein M421DRAFT_97878 [Didymella exigua CBS 183.55]|uniref:C2H2-type domain-containing protein n=1 Tax=Didymella exigua CBS 183.55 TaxID=1150837 RepID=A0A6A5RYZ0_9PLEO|nr:uncharacterized protein M421DRAFT_97878 [Didymella exigua CBS 183.55]KAF1932570.1 hypothetical protein M421DRAFT_97878 [Didymella exigua CBS 183.55]